MVEPGRTELKAVSLPEEVTVQGGGDIRLRPNEMRLLKAATGKPLSELMGEGADEADGLQLLAWLELRREGFNPSWEDAGDVFVRLIAAEPDPTKSGRSETSPPFASGTE